MPTNQPGARRVDDRRIVSEIIHMLRTGGRWRDCPADYGPHTTVYNRFNRWSRRGCWRAMLAALAEAGWIAETAAIDSTYVKAHRSAHGGNVWPAPSASGFCDLIRPVCINVSGLGAAAPAKMEIRASRAS